MGFLAAVLDESFFFECYTPLGELMDMMALINCTINFILYCLMSRLFRTTGRKIIGLQAKEQNERPLPSRFTFGLTAVGALQRGTVELGTITHSNGNMRDFHGGPQGHAVSSQSKGKAPVSKQALPNQKSLKPMKEQNTTMLVL